MKCKNCGISIHKDDVIGDWWHEPTGDYRCRLSAEPIQKNNSQIESEIGN